MAFPSGAAHRITARIMGQTAAQRATKPTDGENVDSYLLARRDQAVKNGWTAEANRCFFCGDKSWKTGVIPDAGNHPMAYCKKHADAYARIRDRKPNAAQVSEARRASLRTHMRGKGRLEGTLCGVEPDDEQPKITTQWQLVDCQRCLSLRGK